MKRLLAALLFMPCLAWGAFQPVTGSSVTVFTTQGGSLKVDGSGVTQPVSGTLQVSNSTHAVTQNGLWTIANSTIAISNTGFTANAGTNLNTSALALESGGNLATLAGAVSSAKVQSNVIGSTVGVVNGGTPFQIANSTIAFANTTIATTQGTNPWVVGNSTIAAIGALLVSSNTATPTAIADGGMVKNMGDNYGRQITMPIAPWGMVRVATATLTTSTAERIFISSTSAKINRLIGCIGENSSATAADITIRMNGGPSANDTGSFKLGMSASNVPVGFFPPMGIPAQLANANVTIQGSASVTSLFLTCWFTVE